jgi:hypothetical protein
VAPVWLVGPSASPSARWSTAPRSCSPSLPTNTSTCRSSSARQLKTSLLLVPPSLVSSFPSFFARRSRSLPPRPLSSPYLGHLLRSRGAAALGVVRPPDLGVRAEGGMKSSLRTEVPAGAAAGQQWRNHRRHAAVPLRPQFRQGQILRHPLGALRASPFLRLSGEVEMVGTACGASYADAVVVRAGKAEDSSMTLLGQQEEEGHV